MVGIDIEKICPIDDISSTMGQFASPQEQYWILESETLKRFYMLWSAKESLLKAIGTGFAIQHIPCFEKINFISENVILFQTFFSNTLSCLWDNHSIALSMT